MLLTRKARIAAFVLNYGGRKKTIDDFPEKTRMIMKMMEILVKIEEKGNAGRERNRPIEENRDDEIESKAEKADRLRRKLRR